MDHFEMVEKLREKANVTYEEAKDALEASDWDLLDALLMLESKGRLQEMESEAYSTRQDADTRNENSTGKKNREHGFFSTLLRGLGKVIQKGNSVSVLITKKGETRLSLPLTVVVIAFVFMFWWMLIAFAAAMLFGYRFSVKGLSFDASVNNAMDKAGDFVDNVVKPGSVHVIVDKDENKSDPADNDCKETKD
ncbi:MAG: DUF4342 domain-containing protein [Clostridia bacterium]|nr:DUF4342 domain-containing protein [Clostridia bacterium]